MRYEAAKRHGGTLNAYWQMEEANLKSLHSDFSSMTFRQNYRDSGKIIVARSLGRERGEMSR